MIEDEIDLYFDFITPHIVVNTSGMVRSGNFGAISLDDFVIVVDSVRWAEVGELFRKKLESHFKKPLRYFVLTHYHGDHRSGASVFKDCTLIISQRMAGIMPRNFRLKSWEAITFAENYTIQDEDLKVQIYRLGGHTAGSSIIYFPYERTVFAGDIVVENYPWIIYVGDKTCDLEEWLIGLEFMSKLEIEKVIPGHGPILSTKDELKKHIELFTKMKSFVIEAIKKGKTIDELDLPRLEIVEKLLSEKENIIEDAGYPLNASQQRRFQIALDKGKQTIMKKFYEFYSTKKEYSQ